jgi:hypothetical protein
VGLDGNIGSFNDRVHGSSKTRGRFPCAGGMWSNVGGLSAEHASEAGLARHGMMGHAKPDPMRAIRHSLRSMASGLYSYRGMYGDVANNEIGLAQMSPLSFLLYHSFRKLIPSLTSIRFFWLRVASFVCPCWPQRTLLFTLFHLTIRKCETGVLSSSLTA